MQQDNSKYDTENTDEIQIREIIDFFRSHIILLTVFVICGAGIAAFFAARTPAQYEAIAQLRPAQVRTTSLIDPNLASDLKGAAIWQASMGISAEPATDLIARLMMPSGFNDSTRAACAVESVNAPAQFLQIVQVANLVEMRVRRSSSEVAAQCAQAFFELARKQQATVLKPFFDELEEQLAKTRANIRENQAVLNKLDQSITGASFVGLKYLAIFEDTRKLQYRAESIESDLLFSKNRETRLNAPIFVSTINGIKPRNTILIGALAGLAAGLLAAMANKMLKQKRP
ncbi:hypothetical protein [Herbaspirillum robiniae]|uniref:hypothetical protein n=1 Tax=Herbaspirillum robiniae TaxID=2014887 RepID=UPI003D7836DF